MKYGVFMGRFQPLHLGHQLIINEIFQDGLTPIIALGSANKSDEKNPLSVRRREQLFREVYGPAVYVDWMTDHDNWTDWRDEAINTLQGYSPNREDFVLYFHVKPEDKADFVCGNVHYKQEHYSRLFDGLYTIRHAELPVKFPTSICASSIRSDLENNRQYVDGRVYRKLKEWGW